jgi:hypothetical protein
MQDETEHCARFSWARTLAPERRGQSSRRAQVGHYFQAYRPTYPRVYDHLIEEQLRGLKSIREQLNAMKTGYQSCA